MTDLEFIFSRRSIRRFTPEKVSGSQIMLLLEAAMAAPTAMNTQPWHLVVIEDPEKLAELRTILPFGKMQVPLAISICGNLGSIKKLVTERFWVQDCSAATENLLLAANAMGLGAVWCGVHPINRLESSIKALLNLPEAVVPLNVVYIGHPAEQKPARSQFDQTKISYNLFDRLWESPTEKE
jgi:nitroreductase